MKKNIRLYVYISLVSVTLGALQARDCCDTPKTSCAQPCFLLSEGSNGCCGDCSSAFIPRSTGDNLVTQATYHNYQDTDCFSVNFNLDYRFQRSFHTCSIANSLFGTSIVRFQGSNIKATDAAISTALIADNFGLSPNTNSAILFSPRITNNIFDFQLYVGLDNWCNGLFFQLNLPLTHTKWALRARDGSAQTVISNPNCCSVRHNIICSDDCGTPAFPLPAQTPFNAGCMGSFTNPTPPAQPDGVASAPTLEDALGGDFLFGDMQTAWNAGRFDFANDANHEATELASVNMILGYNIWECQDYNFGIFLRAAAPTGTNEGCCVTRNVFNPHIGDNHWKLGGGITGHYELYTCSDDYVVNLYFEGYAEHLFKRCQARSFDFARKGCLSRYMLLKEFDANNVYTGTIINGINFATRKVETSIAVQGEGILEFVYSDNCGFSAGLGWNIYGRSCEKACSLGAPCDASIDDRRFGFKGCASVQGQCVAVTTGGGVSTITGPLTITSTNLNSTQSNATITSCGTVDNPTVAVVTPPVGVGTVCLDACSLNESLLVVGSTFSAGSSATTATLTPPGVEVNLAVTSAIDGAPEPVIIDPATAFDVRSGLLKSYLTNKIFGHLDCEWADVCYTPKAYIGAEVEFAGKSHCQTMNAWGFYIGGNLTY